MSERTYYYLTDSFYCSYEYITDIVTIRLKKDQSRYNDLTTILKDHPKGNVVIKGIESVDTINLLMTIFANYNYDGTVTFDLLDYDFDLEGLDRNTIIDLSNIPSYIRINGFLPKNEQNGFSIWAHNQGEKTKEILSNCLIKADKIEFEEQERIINDFYNVFMEEYKEDYENKSIEDEKPKKVFEQIIKLIQKKYVLDRSLALDGFTGDFAKNEFSKADDPVEIYKEGKGTSDGRVQLLTLLANNSVFKLTCSPACGELACGSVHEWNEFVDSDGQIFHYDLAFNIDVPEDRLIKTHERTLEEEFPEVTNNRVVYVLHQGLGKKEDKNKSA